VSNAVQMQIAIQLGQKYPPDGVADTPDNRQLLDDIAQALAGMPPGTVVDTPSDPAGEQRAE
jgi:hypothetical protein